MKASKEYANNSRLHRLCDSTKAAIERAINEARKEAVNECAKRLRIRLYAGSTNDKSLPQRLSKAVCTSNLMDVTFIEPDKQSVLDILKEIE